LAAARGCGDGAAGEAAANDGRASAGGQRTLVVGVVAVAAAVVAVLLVEQQEEASPLPPCRSSCASAPQRKTAPKCGLHEDTRSVVSSRDITA